MDTNSTLRSKHVIACVWDFDKTLIKGYMQTPIFKAFGIDEKLFWKEVNLLPELYKQRNIIVSPETIYLNHLLSYVKCGAMRGLSNKKLREFGKDMDFCDGIPTFFDELKNIPKSDDRYVKLGIELEHYIISTGLAEVIRGTDLAKSCEDIFGCEFIEEPYPAYFSMQPEFDLEAFSSQITQIGVMVDNTIKTRFVFEINKGSNKIPEIDVNSSISNEDRRVPIKNMIYIADGPSDVPVFSVVRRGGGKAFAVYSPDNIAEFEQNDLLLENNRIDSYGPNVYTSESQTSRWIKMHVKKICDRIVRDVDTALDSRLGKAPKHIHPLNKEIKAEPNQSELF